MSSGTIQWSDSSFRTGERGKGFLRGNCSLKTIGMTEIGGLEMQRLNSSYSRIALARNLLAVATLTTAFISIDHARATAADAAVGDESAAVNKLFEQWDTPSSPGCAVAVMKDGRILFEHGYGMADLDHNVPITTATVFNVGSIAKQFTGAAILMLAQEGKLSLDDPIRKYLPELPDFGVPITLRQMLAHTSGLRDYEILLVDDDDDARGAIAGRAEVPAIPPFVPEKEHPCAACAVASLVTPTAAPFFLVPPEVRRALEIRAERTIPFAPAPELPARAPPVSPAV